MNFNWKFWEKKTEEYYFFFNLGHKCIDILDSWESNEISLIELSSMTTFKYNPETKKVYKSAMNYKDYHTFAPIPPVIKEYVKTLDNLYKGKMRDETINGLLNE